MKLQFGVFFLIVICASIVIISQLDVSENFELLLENSGPYIGVDYPKDLGYQGEGIVIGIIDTGVDHMHPDLLGFGYSAKVISGYNFVDSSKMPIDTNGHGTQVAGIIAANGQVQGIAPKSSLVSYKVSDDGEEVASDLIVKAIEQAITDDVDIINISLGVNRTNSKIDEAVNKAVEHGIVVIAAAGNDGPELGSIGSPGKNPNAITVGATYNNITSSLVATLEVNEKQYQVLPMVGVSKMRESIKAEILFAEYGRERDFADGNFADSIVLVERGSDVEDEIVYFSDKENNAANAGAKALLVYNKEQGIFLGELVHEFVQPEYQPSIPTVSLSRDDGLAIKDLLINQTKGELHVFYNPDFVAHFSSRGPVSPFYNKPDLVAPGVFVNTTISNGQYNYTSGTSFAAPHVTGAVALLLEKNPELSPKQIKSLITTTTDSVSDAYSKEFPLEIAGAGRLNLTKAFSANTIIWPAYAIFDLSTEKQSDVEVLSLEVVSGELEKLDVRFEGPEIIDYSFSQEGNLLEIFGTLNEQVFGEFEGKIFIKDSKSNYNIPISIRITEGSVSVTEQDGVINFGINHPDDWAYAKISLTNAITGKSDTTSATPSKMAKLSVNENGQYWVEAKINVNGETFDAFETVEVKSATNGINIFDSLNIPERQVFIIFGIIIVVTAVGLKIRK
jgi:minor extracellular serine protease Vpr